MRELGIEIKTARKELFYCVCASRFCPTRGDFKVERGSIPREIGTNRKEEHVKRNTEHARRNTEHGGLRCVSMRFATGKKPRGICPKFLFKNN